MKRIAIGWLSALPLISLAEPPTLDSIWPPGGKRGSDFPVTLTGKLEPWPCRVHFSEKGFTFTPDPGKPGTGTLSIDPGVPPGPVLARVTNPDGTSDPRIFLVDELEEAIETEEDGNTVAGAQALEASALPLVLNGRLPANNELDSFRLPLKEGETLFAAVEGYSIRSLIDPVLHVYNPEGYRLIMAHDGAVHLDPLLEFTAPEDGDYVVAVTAFAHPPATSVFYRGGKNARYRLYLARKKDQLPARLLPSPLGGDSPEGSIPIGKSVTGTLTEPDPEDRWTVSAKKDQLLHVGVKARSLGYPLDPVLRILKPDGSELRLIDDTDKETDPGYLWKVPADGDYTLCVTDRFRRGGAEMRYRLELGPAEPGFTATMTTSSHVLEPGKSAELKVKVTRRQGHKADLHFEIPGLPDCLTVTPPEKVPEKGGDVVVRIEAAKDAPAFQKPLTLEAWEKDEEGRKKGEPRTVTVTFRDDNYRGPYAIMETAEFWLTIPPPKKTEADKEGEKKEAKKE